MPDEDDLEEMNENTVMDAMHTLYVKASARKFLLIDLPPVGRSPGGALVFLILLVSSAYSCTNHY